MWGAHHKHTHTHTHTHTQPNWLTHSLTHTHTHKHTHGEQQGGFTDSDAHGMRIRVCEAPLLFTMCVGVSSCVCVCEWVSECVCVCVCVCEFINFIILKKIVCINSKRASRTRMRTVMALCSHTRRRSILIPQVPFFLFFAPFSPHTPVALYWSFRCHFCLFSKITLVVATSDPSGT